MNVIVSHPAKQGNVYERPRAAERAGMHIRFLTGLYYLPERFPYSLVSLLPIRLRQRLVNLLEKRRIQGLSPSNVISLLGPTLELSLRPLGLVPQWDDAHDWLASRWIRKYVQNNTPTVLHTFQGTCRRTLRAAKNKRIIRLLEVTLPPLDRSGSASRKFLAELSEADFVLAQSEFSVKSLLELGARPEQIIRCHLGVDAFKFHPRVSERQPGPLRILFVGNIGKRKGVHILLQAWNELRIEDAELLLIGNNRSQEAAQLLQQKGPQCESLGHVSDQELLKLFQHADILVHPSLSEGGCNVVYEALASGLPAIVSSNAGSAVRDGKEGFVVPPGDVAALKRAIRQLCVDSPLRQQMGQAARARAESLSWDSYSMRLAKVYSVLGEAATNNSRAVREDLRGTF
jgi:alpha-maltose-1-phosphate synthase